MAAVGPAVKAGPRARLYPWLVLAILWLACFFNYADRLALSAVLPPLQNEFHFTEYQLGWLSSSFLIVYALTVPITGYFADRYNRKAILVAGLVCWSLLTYFTATSKSFVQLLLFRGLTGIGEAFYFPAAMSLLSDYHGPATRSRALSAHQTAVYAGTVGGGAAAGYLAQFFGWRAAFTVFGAGGLAIAWLLVRAVREPARGDRTEQKVAPPGDLLRSPGVILLVLAFVAANFVAMGLLAWLPKYVFDRFHTGLGAAGTIATAYLQTASLAGVLSGGWLADSLYRRHPSGRGVTLALGLVLGVPFLVVCGLSPTVHWFVLGAVGFGLAKGIYDSNIFAALFDLVPLQARAAATGLLIAIGYLSGSGAPVLLGRLAPRFGLGWQIAAFAPIYAAGALLVAASLRFFPKERSQ